MSFQTFKPTVAIIGAGPAGLTLARLLHLQNIPFTVFESEPSVTSRSQGGTLDLRDKTGLAAITACQLYDEFLKLARFDGEALKITDKDMKVWLKVDGGGGGKRRKNARPEIDRVALRALLLESIPRERVMWRKKLRSVAGEADDLKLRFEDGEEVGGFDLIVGADGAWSKTRNFLSDEMPTYSGICGIDQNISDAEKRFPDISAMVDRGSIFAFGDGKSVIAQQIGDGSIKISEYGVRDVSWAKEHDATKMEPGAIKELLGKEYDDWSPDFRKMLESVDEEGAVTRALYALPIPFQWENKPGVTVIGDAAHVMLPFAGEGANLSMADAMHLARWIQKSTDRAKLRENLVGFENEMFAKMEPIQQISHDNTKDMFFTPGAPRTTIESYITRYMKHMAGPVVGTLAGVGIYTYYWAWKLLS
ncbi:FAD/NAD(P)-binding domain-containing protein [Hyaloscypha hepaticicola]|uniref:FAD/NAD(P)-binding domain-containing protein n=1 Tax=Hyaloscypha hepaticicola TaxID=2082293 RepID=A0A2J6PEB4_9HELO|nr:FAD/NAD(P)-binding domain-containing protein [Hyaloscypha hepaticicola]